MTAEDDKPVTANHQASVKTASPTFRERGSGYVSPSTKIMKLDKTEHLYSRGHKGWCAQASQIIGTNGETGQKLDLRPFSRFVWEMRNAIEDVSGPVQTRLPVH
ncbi:hypothetical protein E2C01_074295 [Portunus trituberculatus]|uniref:Uncharacterized protein n=1 Tax=Portunus trituberculatus TaxID=210409 RepID=A0A5B7I304_PORTR|nr:hypothetical protein [Portunus trituberculatus]